MPEKEQPQGKTSMQQPQATQETAQKKERVRTDEPQPTEGDPLPVAGENQPDLAREERERVLAIVRAVLLEQPIPDSLTHAWEKIAEGVKAET
jgi:hypothetical protein